MGCYPPLEKIVSKALGKCNGRDRWRSDRWSSDRWRKERLDYALAYPPGAPTEIHYVRPVARTVNFASNNSIYVIPPSPPPQPEPQQQQQQKQSPPEPPQQPQTPPQQEPEREPDEPEPEQHHDAPQPQPQPQLEQPAADAEPPAQTQDPPPAPPAEPKPPKVPKRGKKKHSGRVRFGPEPPPPPQQQQQEEQQSQQEEHDDGQGPGDSGSAPGQQQGAHGAAPSPGPAPAQGRQGYLHLLRYTPSPLPRWEATPRRHEYFSGEYRSYYPTPVREGIYRIATDANRLTTIFSEENPNACTIV